MIRSSLLLLFLASHAHTAGMIPAVPATSSTNTWTAPNTFAGGVGPLSLTRGSELTLKGLDLAAIFQEYVSSSATRTRIDFRLPGTTARREDFRFLVGSQAPVIISTALVSIDAPTMLVAGDPVFITPSAGSDAALFINSVDDTAIWSITADNATGNLHIEDEVGGNHSISIGTMTLLNNGTSPPNNYALCLSNGVLGHCTTTPVNGICVCFSP